MKTRMARRIFRLAAAGIAATLLAAAPVTAGEGDAPAAGVASKPRPGARQRDAWIKASRLMVEAERESRSEVDRIVAELDARFERADGNVRGFVEDMLGWGGKFRFAAGGVEQAVNGTARLLGRLVDSDLGQPMAADRFAEFARGRFTEQVFEPAEFKRALDAAAATYASRVEAIEARLWVELEADLPDGKKPRMRGWGRKSPEALLEAVDAAVADAIATATQDFMVESGKFAASQVGGGWLSGMMLSGAAAVGLSGAQNDNPWSAPVLATGVVAGFVVDKALDKVAQAAGYDPAGALAAKVKARLAEARRALVEGDEAAARAYEKITLACAAYPSTTARLASHEAAVVLERRGELGLRPRLVGLHDERSAHRREVLWRLIFDTDGSTFPPPANLYIDPAALGGESQVVRFAHDVIHTYGKEEQ